MHSALSAILFFTLAVLWKLEGAQGTEFWYSVVPEVRDFPICDLPFAYVSESLFGLSTASSLIGPSRPQSSYHT